MKKVTNDHMKQSLPIRLQTLINDCLLLYKNPKRLRMPLVFLRGSQLRQKRLTEVKEFQTASFIDFAQQY